MRPPTNNSAPVRPLPPRAGRPQIPLLIGQAMFVEQAFRHRYSQSRIAREIQTAIPRVRRHLVERGLYTPRPAVRTPAREAQLAAAVQEYVAGMRVLEICAMYHVNPAELYREIRNRRVPLRRDAITHEVSA